MASEPAKKTRVAIDATVLFAGSGWPRWPREVLLAGLRGDIQLVVSPIVIEQARRNLQRKYPEHVARFEEFLARASFEMLPDASAEEIERSRGLVRDEDDLPVVLPAIAAHVDYLVSEDKDLTVNDDTTESLHQRLKVLLSGTFLRRILGWSTEDLERIRGRTWKDVTSGRSSGSKG